MHEALATRSTTNRARVTNDPRLSPVSTAARRESVAARTLSPSIFDVLSQTISRQASTSRCHRIRLFISLYGAESIEELTDQCRPSKQDIGHPHRD